MTDGDEALAQLLGLPVEVTARALGAGFTEVLAPAHERWFVSGEPAQVAVGWDGFGFTLARPEHRLDGCIPSWVFAAERTFQAEEVLYDRQVLAEAAEEVARRRRRTFRWCPVCREVNAREDTYDNTGLCGGCADRFLGLHD